MEQQALRFLIQRKLADGRLPHDSISGVWGGPGNGETCDACGDIISMEHFVMKGIPEGRAAVQFHVECFYLWVMEKMGAASVTGLTAGQ